MSDIYLYIYIYVPEAALICNLAKRLDHGIYTHVLQRCVRLTQCFDMHLGGYAYSHGEYITRSEIC